MLVHSAALGSFKMHSLSPPTLMQRYESQAFSNSKTSSHKFVNF